MAGKVFVALCGLAIAAVISPSVVTAAAPLIAVSGSASTTVATDELSISFALSTEGESFSDAKHAADEVVDTMKTHLARDYAGRVQVVNQVAVLKQKRISWSSKAKRLDHRVTVRIGGFQEDLPEQAVTLLDQLLALDSRLEVTDMEGRLSDDKAAQARAQLLVTALRDARHKANALAREAGQRVSALRVVNAAPGYELSRYGNLLSESIAVHARSFRVTADLVGQVEISVELVAEYETTPL